mmetsp:Transcript_33892/g.94437  ORF Transcript_33892/g.94437 Transcript_33892/m.94437 type:complete len:299 (-) Transcript_33892:7-903(-)
MHLLLHVRDLLERGLGDTVVIMLDSWDVAYLGCDRDLLRSFLAFRRPLFFSAELAAYPHGEAGLVTWRRRFGDYPSAGAGPSYHALPRCAPNRGARPCRAWFRHGSAAHRGRCTFCVPTSLGGGYRFLNSGCWGGYAWAVERALSRIYDSGAVGTMTSSLLDIPRERSSSEIFDQVWWVIYLDAYRHEIALDYGATICTSLHGLDPRRDLLVLERRGGGRAGAPARASSDGVSPEHMVAATPYWRRRLLAVPFAKDVCFAHGNAGLGGLVSRIVDVLGRPAWAQIIDPSHPLFSLLHG